MKILVFIAITFGTQLIGQNETIITLCEGNYGSSNASIWSFDDSFSGIVGPIHWDANSNPLGDVAQSLFIDDDKLYIVVNNSHSIEVMDVGSGDPVYERTITIPGTSPRYMTVLDGLGYVSCWNLQGILVIDLLTDSFLDTIPVSGLPEDILIVNNKLYVAITMDTDWHDGEMVAEYDILDSYAMTNTYTVLTGPNRLLYFNDHLYVTSVYYDENWVHTYYGTSKINLTTGSVLIRDYGITSAYNNDIVLFGNQILRVIGTGIAPLTDSLRFDTTAVMGDFPGIYSIDTDGEYFYIGTTDYSAPDQVYIMDADGNVIHQFQVGAIPGDFAFYNTTSADNGYSVSLVPEQETLMTNYPNPFNPSTRLTIDSPTGSQSRIEIVNITGQHITTLHQGWLTAGHHAFCWNGNSQSSGVYFAVLRQKDCVTIQKLNLIK